MERSVVGGLNVYYAMKRSEPQSSGAGSLDNLKHACINVSIQETLVQNGHGVRDGETFVSADRSLSRQTSGKYRR